MIRRGFIAAVLLAALVTACSDGNDSKSASTGVPVASDSPAPGVTGEGGSVSGAALDCGALEPLVGSVLVNIQILAQLPAEADVAQWPIGIGTMPQFGNQLAALAVLVPFDAGVAEQLSYFEAANEIAQRGYAGDTAAPAELAAYLGDDLTAVLTRQVPLGAALAAAGC